MKFSVLMPVYEKEKSEYLEEAIKSIINQTLKPNQIVIVKDGELPIELDSIIEKYKNKYSELIDLYSFQNKVGLAVALNKGISLCKYEYIARMDSDDVSNENRFEKQISYLKENPNIDILGGLIEEYDEKMEKRISIRKVPLKQEQMKENIKQQNPFNHSTVILKKSTVLHLGGYSKMKLEDYDLWARMLINNCEMANLNEVLVRSRAGKSLYKRRSGIKYVKAILELEKCLLNYKIINKYEYCTNILKRVLLALMPVSFKLYIYPKVIRKIKFKK